MDPFADLWAAPSPPVLPSTFDLGRDLGGTFGPSGGAGMSPTAGGLDDLFGLGPAVKGSDAVAQFLGSAAVAAGEASDLDPLAMFSPPPATPARPAPTLPVADRTPEVHGSMPLPQPRAAVPAPAPAPVTAHPVRPGEADPLWAAFCDGAGIGLTPPGGLNPELMRVIGQMLRRSVDGTLQLVTARATTKVELHAQVTMIQPRNNNPLKFSPDGRMALEQLLQPPLRGFLPGPAAIDQAMDDLVGHTVGTMAGMRAALDGVLARFAPDQLEAKLTRQSVFDSVLPMHRRARLWELYLQHFQSVSDDAKDDFHSLFGKAFLNAYEEQLDRLDASRQAGVPPSPEGPAR